MIGSMGFMAPEQISGNPGPEADVFAWGVTVAYAASGRSPFGAGSTHSILYKIMYGDADISTVPDSLRPLVEDALIKDPQSRPTARQLLDRLTSASRRNEETNENPTQLILRRTWQSGSHPSPSPAGARSPNRPAEPLSRVRPSRLPAPCGLPRPRPGCPPGPRPGRSSGQHSRRGPVDSRPPARPPSQAAPSPRRLPGPRRPRRPRPRDGASPSRRPPTGRPRHLGRRAAARRPRLGPPHLGLRPGDRRGGVLSEAAGRPSHATCTSALAAMRLRRSGRREPGQ